MKSYICSIVTKELNYKSVTESYWENPNIWKLSNTLVNNSLAKEITGKTRKYFKFNSNESKHIKHCEIYLKHHSESSFIPLAFTLNKKVELKSSYLSFHLKKVEKESVLNCKNFLISRVKEERDINSVSKTWKRKEGNLITTSMKLSYFQKIMPILTKVEMDTWITLHKWKKLNS